MKPSVNKLSGSGVAKAAADTPTVGFQPPATYDAPGPLAQEHRKSAASPAIPPDWARYIDSRLKQFCTR